VRGDIIVLTWGDQEHEVFPTKKAAAEKQRELREQEIKTLLYEFDPVTLEERLPKTLRDYEAEHGHSFHRRLLRRDLVPA
jgi:hypothetical protein